MSTFIADDAAAIAAALKQLEADKVAVRQTEQVYPRPPNEYVETKSYTLPPLEPWDYAP